MKTISIALKRIRIDGKLKTGGSSFQLRNPMEGGGSTLRDWNENDGNDYSVDENREQDIGQAVSR